MNLRFIFFGLLSGVLSGAVASLFLFLLELVTRFRISHPGLIYLLPLAGFAIGWAYHRYGSEFSDEHRLILSEVRDPKKVTPPHTAFFLLSASLLTHWFGGSAGREGAAVQAAASLSDQLCRFFKIKPEERAVLLMCGAGAGFGAAAGAPLAGVVFGWEGFRARGFRWAMIIPCFVASMVAFQVTRIFGVHHTVYPVSVIPDFSWVWAPSLAVAGIAFGLSARVFKKMIRFVKEVQVRFVSYPPLRPMIAGFILIALTLLLGTDRYNGLGLETIQEGLIHHTAWTDPLLKGVFTALTLGSGFKGGEFIPLVFIGTTLGSALSAILSVPGPLLASLGFSAVFAGAAGAPIACSILSIELFGIGLAPYALIVCLMSSFVARGGR